MLKLFVAFLVIFSALAILPSAKAAPGPAAGNCDEYVHHASIALTNVITAGDFEAWGGVGCEGPRTDHSVVFFNGQASGPALAGLFLGTVTQDWGVDTGQIPGGAIGCTVGTPPVPHTAANTQSGLFTVTLIPITMTSNECTVPIRYHLSLAVAAVEVFNWFATFTVHLAVDEPPLTYLCAATSAAPNAFDYDTATCNAPTLNAALTGQLSQLNYQCAATLGTPNAFNPATNTCFTAAQLQYQCGATGLTVNTQTNTAQCTNPQVDNQVRLCAASGFGAACTTPTINAALSGTINAILSGTLTLSGALTISDDAGGWIIHQDPLSGTITVNCIGCSDTVNVGDVNVAPANVTVNVNATVAATNVTVEQPPENPGFDGSLYVLLTVIALALGHMGELRSDNKYRIIAGGFMLAGSLAIFRELDRLGFSHMQRSTITMALVIMAIQWIAAIYLFVPKNYNETEET